VTGRWELKDEQWAVVEPVLRPIRRADNDMRAVRIENFLGFVHLACLHMLDQAFMRQFRNREYISSQPRKSLLLPAELPPSTIRIFNL
jgi:hypothetical protein